MPRGGPRLLLLLLVLLAPIAWALSATTPLAAAEARLPALPALTVLAAGDLRGEIKPCGCSPEGQLGGLPRRLSYLEQAVAATPPPILVDLGNNYPEATPQGIFKIDLIRDLLRRYAPQAVLPGPGELALGLGALRGELPYVLSNDARGEAFAAVQSVRRGGRRVGIYGFLSPQTVYQGPQSTLALRPANGALLADLRRRMAGRGDDATVLLFRGADDELAPFVRAGLFDLIVTGNPSADEMQQVTERTVAGVPVAQVPTKGQGVLRLHLGRPRDAGKEPATEIAVDWLTERWADHAAAAPVFAAYDERVTALFFTRVEAQARRAQESPYAGAAACLACHAPQHQVWVGSRHSRALATLERVGKQYDPECLTCHVVGLQRDGFLSADLTPQFANVQCENCHGAAKAHAALPTVKPGPVPHAGGAALAKPAEATCRGCHVGSHSPKFDFAHYWPKIAHGAAPPAAPPAAEADRR